MLEKIQETAAFLKAKMHTHPETAIILGTGLGSLVHEITDKYEINYEFPGFNRRRTQRETDFRETGQQGHHGHAGTLSFL